MEEPRPKPKARPDSTPKHAKYRQLSLPSSIGFTAVLPTPLGYLDRCHCWQCVPARLKATEKAGQEHRRGPSTVKPRPKAPPYTARWGSSGKAGQASRSVHRRLASSPCVVWCYRIGPAYMLVRSVVPVGNGIVLRISPNVKRSLFRLNSVGCGSRIYEDIYLQGGICV